MVNEPESSAKDVATEGKTVESPTDPSAAEKPQQTEAAGLAGAATSQAEAGGGAAGATEELGDESASATTTGAASDPRPDNRLGDALAALDRKDYATARLLFEAIGRKDASEAIGNALAALDRKDYATAQGLFEAFAPPTPPMSSARPTAAPVVASKSGAAAEAAPPVVAPTAEAIERGSSLGAQPSKRRRPPAIPLAAALALLAIIGAFVLYGSRQNWTLAAAKGQAHATFASTGKLLASASDLVTARLEALIAPSQSRERHAETPDVGAALTQLTIRLDRIEHQYGARLDELNQRIAGESSAQATDIAARLDALEKKSVPPAQAAPDLADIVTRLDKLEKKVAATTASSAELAEITKRISGLEKRTTVLAAGSETPLPPPAPKRSTKVAKAEPSASNDALTPDSSRPLLRDYTLEGVRDGLAMVDGRYGPLEVGPGDYIPGAGRVLRIERRGGAWLVETSRGVIASDPGAY